MRTSLPHSQVHVASGEPGVTVRRSPQDPVKKEKVK
jgi:hypothetical protein